MRYAIAFGTVGCAAVLLAALVPFTAARVLAGWVAVSFGAAALAYAGLGPRLLGKRATGDLPLWSLALNGPFLLTGLASMRFVRMGIGEAPWHEIAPGVLLGRRPSRLDRASFRSLGVTAVLDLCAELPATRTLTGTEHYKLLPVLDYEAPTLAQLEEAVAFVEAHRATGKVLVHCALGHSRSATVVAAWRMATDPREVDAVEADLRAARPGVLFTEPQREVLRAWRERLAVRAG